MTQPEIDQALLIPTVHERPEFVRTLLSQGADANTSGVIHAAVQSGKVDSLRYILDAHAEIDSQDEMGDTPLHHAARANPGSKAVELMTFLLERGARIDIPNQEGRTALHAAASCSWDTLERMKVLLAAGAELHKRYGGGQDMPNLAAQQESMQAMAQHLAGMGAPMSEAELAKRKADVASGAAAELGEEFGSLVESFYDSPAMKQMAASFGSLMSGDVSRFTEGPTAAEVVCNYQHNHEGHMVHGSVLVPILEAFEAECRNKRAEK